MADNTANIGFEKQIWDAACVLRGNIDASEYKSVVISKSQIDETLIGAGEKLGAYSDRRVKGTMHQLVEQQSGCVRPFIENITMINQMYNQPLSIVFNNETLYIAAGE